MAIGGNFECSDCKCRLKKDDFMAIIGKALPESLSIPMGRADVIFKQVGEIYCDKCFYKRYAKK